MPNTSTYGRILSRLRAAPALAVSQARDIYGLVPIFINHRQGDRWTPKERAAVSRRLRVLAHVTSYVVLFVLPGSILFLPLLAWWFRRQTMSSNAAPAAVVAIGK